MILFIPIICGARYIYFISLVPFFITGSQKKRLGADMMWVDGNGKGTNESLSGHRL